MVAAYKSVTVTKSTRKLVEWNEINPTSEKPKFGRGAFDDKMKKSKGMQMQINDCHFERRTKHGLQSVTNAGIDNIDSFLKKGNLKIILVNDIMKIKKAKHEIVDKCRGEVKT